MHIKEFTLDNITSYANSTTFHLNPDLNIFIGPNGGGKTNALQVLWVTLEKFLFSKFNVTYDGQEKINVNENDMLGEGFDRFLEPYDNSIDRQIEVVIRTDLVDAGNIELILKNIGDLESQFTVGFFDKIKNISQEQLNEISKGVDIKVILNGSLSNKMVRKSPEPGVEEIFFEYCKIINLIMRSENSDLALNMFSPIFFIQSARQSNVGIELLDATTERSAYYNVMSGTVANAGANMRDSSSQYFSHLMQKASHHSNHNRDSLIFEVFEKEPDVIDYRSYLRILGFEWFIDPLKQRPGRFKSIFKKNGKQVDPRKFSSGEKEIFNFIDGIISTKVKNGIVIIDEPELHLHPRWQKIYLNLFLDLSRKRNLQFIFSTHSPTFITTNTLNSVIRVYQNEGISKISSIHDIKDISEKRHLVHIINSHNNEKMFFADKVVLVEGITDRLIFENIIINMMECFNIKKTIEVIDVHGKDNFKYYFPVLKSLSMPYNVIADFDYLDRIGSLEVKNLFLSDIVKAGKKTVEDKKSKDGKALLEAINANRDFESIKKIAEHIQNRFKKLKPNLSSKDQSVLHSFIEDKRCEGLYVLKRGEIENYLPLEYRSVEGVIQLVEVDRWIERIDQDKREELLCIAANILELDDFQKDQLIKK